ASRLGIAAERDDQQGTRVNDRFQQQLTRDYATIYRTYVLLELAPSTKFEFASTDASLAGPTVYDARPVGKPDDAFRLALVAVLFLLILGTAFLLNRLSRGFYELAIYAAGVLAVLGLFTITFPLFF
ncbi:MAG: hypothetical protein AAFN70_21270, partial [Planctomycetota bacterium]